METKPSAGWDLSLSRAEIHEHYLVPSLYAQWAIRLTALAHIDNGHKVLDAGCGTGILARKAVEEVGFTGKVIGVDIDEDMLSIGRGKAPNIEWRQEDATMLPFEKGSFDRVVSQFLLPHVNNRVGLIREFLRVLCQGGRMALAVWAPLQYSPAFNILTRLTREQAGQKAADALALPWELGQEHKLQSVLTAAGAKAKTLSRERGTARFPDAETIVELWINRPPVSDEMDDDAIKRIRLLAVEALKEFRVPAGGLVFPMDATVAVVDKD